MIQIHHQKSQQLLCSEIVDDFPVFAAEMILLVDEICFLKRYRFDLEKSELKTSTFFKILWFFEVKEYLLHQSNYFYPIWVKEILHISLFIAVHFYCSLGKQFDSNLIHHILEQE
jgi:hypothetical protein